MIPGAERIVFYTTMEEKVIMGSPRFLIDGTYHAPTDVMEPRGKPEPPAGELRS